MRIWLWRIATHFGTKSHVYFIIMFVFQLLFYIAYSIFYSVVNDISLESKKMVAYRIIVIIMLLMA